MKTQLILEKRYAISEDIVAREIQGEFIIIPIASGFSTSEEEIFSLNEFGKTIFNRLDGKRSLKDIIRRLMCIYSGTQEQIEKDVTAFIKELLRRKMIVEIKKH